MIKINEKFLVNQSGKKVGVFMDIKAYRELLYELEELDEIRAYDVAKASSDERIPFDQAIKEIEKNHR